MSFWNRFEPIAKIEDGKDYLENIEEKYWESNLSSEDNTLTIGRFNNKGNLEGPAIILIDSAEVHESYYRNGKRIGTVRIYNPYQLCVQVYKMLNGSKTGYYTIFRLDGSKPFEGYMKDNHKAGEFRKYQNETRKKIYGCDKNSDIVEY